MDLSFARAPTPLEYFAQLVGDEQDIPLLEAAASLAQDEEPDVDVQQVLADVEGIAFTRFTRADVVRHPLVGRIVEAYDARAAATGGRT